MGHNQAVKVRSVADDVRLVRVFDDRLVGLKRVVGFCYCRRHRGPIDRFLLEKHKCVEKNCVFLKKTNDNYWNQLEAEKEAKRKRKEQRKRQQSHAEALEELVREAFRKFDDIHITKILEEPHAVKVCFIRTRWVDLREAQAALGKRLDKSVIMQYTPTSRELRENLIERYRGTDLLEVPGVGPLTKERLRRLRVFFAEDLLTVDCEDLFVCDLREFGDKFAGMRRHRYTRGIHWCEENLGKLNAARLERYGLRK